MSTFVSDGLTDEERIIAWKASWNPSFDGKCIINPDNTFRSVNDRFCEILGVTPAELIGKSFEGITSYNVRELDARNADLVRKGISKDYILEKCYEVKNHEEVCVILLVSGGMDPNGNFRFFVSRIMEQTESHHSEESEPVLKSKPVNIAKELIDGVDMKKVAIILITSLAAIATFLINHFIPGMG